MNCTEPFHRLNPNEAAVIAIFFVCLFVAVLFIVGGYLTKHGR